MIATIVHVHVKPEFIEAFRAASIANHECSVRELGNCRFDVLQSESDPCYFVLYEAYESKEQAAAHKETDHYRIWRNAVAEMMAEPRKGVPFSRIR